jgi:hypothetical protein
MPETYRFLDRNGVAYDITEAYGFRLHGVDGLGMPEVELQVERHAQLDGEVFLDGRLRKRVITITFDLVKDSENELWTERRRLLEFLKDLAEGFKLECTEPRGFVYQLDLRYAGMYSAPRTREMIHRQQRAVIQAVAHNPLWYNPVRQLWAFVVGGGVGTWGWESDGLGFPAGWGASVAPGTPQSKDYGGTWKDYPVIELSGPMTDIVITNYTTGEELEFLPGYTLDEGDTIEINLTPTFKTVEHSTDGNIIDQLTEESDIGSWHIAAHPEAPGGINSIAVAFTAGNHNSKVYIRYYERYIGI